MLLPAECFSAGAHLARAHVYEGSGGNGLRKGLVETERIRSTGVADEVVTVMLSLDGIRDAYAAMQ